MIRLGIPETMFKPLFMNSPAGFQMFCSNIMFQISTAVRLSHYSRNFFAKYVKYAKYVNQIEWNSRYIVGTLN